MARYSWHGESLTTDILGALAAMAYGAARAAYAINNTGNPDKLKWATVADAVVGAGGLIAKNYTGNVYLHELGEALGFAGFGNLGMWAMVVNKKQNAVPFWRPAEQSKVIQSMPRFSVPAPVPTFVPPAAAAAPAKPASTGNYEFEY